MSVSWIEHKGKKILYCNNSGLSDQDKIFENIAEEERIFKETDEEILLLCDYRNTHIGVKFMEKMMEIGKKLLAPKTKKAAVIGIEGLKGMLLKKYNTITNDKLIPFDTKEEALDYLVEETIE